MSLNVNPNNLRPHLRSIHSGCFFAYPLLMRAITVLPLRLRSRGSQKRVSPNAARPVPRFSSSSETPSANAYIASLSSVAGGATNWCRRWGGLSRVRQVGRMRLAGKSLSNVLRHLCPDGATTRVRGARLCSHLLLLRYQRSSWRCRGRQGGSLAMRRHWRSRRRREQRGV